MAFFASDSQHNHYAVQMRSIAREVGRIAMRLTVSGLSENEMLSLLDLVKRNLNTYSELIEPWAETVATEMVKSVNAGNIKSWRLVSRKIGQELSGGGGLGGIQIGNLLQKRITENVLLIKSIPTKAGERIAKIVRVGLDEGRRAEYLAKEIAETTGVTAARAELIARTEVSKASTALTQVRAASYGSPGYIWRTSRDGAVRESHAEMEGEFVAWEAPPTLDKMTGHAGEFPYCRCYPEVVMPGQNQDMEAA